MPRKKGAEKKELPAAKSPRKRATKSGTPKKAVAQSVPPLVTVEEVFAPAPVTRSWVSVLHDGRVYQTTTKVLNRVVLVSSIAVYLIAFALASFSVFAAEPRGPGAAELKEAAKTAQFSDATGTTASVGQFVAQFLVFFFGALGLMFFCYMVYAGFLWLTAAGEEDKVKKARAIIFHSMMGLIVCLVSFSVAQGWLGMLGKAVSPQTP
ncbi:hypothetical protein HY627_02080 [Candidatus Uhrbacteria bacterium]|nr:hypothetical protein [Candidatus Uhrbacteria bacterium]